MEKWNGVWDKIIGFLVEYDLKTIVAALLNLKWNELLESPVLWIVVVPILGVLVWRKNYNFILFLASLVFLLLLSKSTLGAYHGKALPLPELLEFVGGCLVAVVVNVYFIFMGGGK